MTSITDNASEFVPTRGRSQPTMQSRRILAWVMRLLVAGVFVAAAIHKITNPTAFAVSIDHYQILPEAFVHPLAIVLPWLEIMCAIGIISTAPWRCAASFIGVVLLMIFIIAAGSAWWRGLDVSCGCFTSSAKASPIGPWFFARNVLLIIAIGVGAWTDWVALYRNRTST